MAKAALRSLASSHRSQPAPRTREALAPGSPSSPSGLAAVLPCCRAAVPGRRRAGSPSQQLVLRCRRAGQAAAAAARATTSTRESMDDFHAPAGPKRVPTKPRASKAAVETDDERFYDAHDEVPTPEPRNDARDEGPEPVLAAMPRYAAARRGSAILDDLASQEEASRGLRRRLEEAKQDGARLRREAGLDRKSVSPREAPPPPPEPASPLSPAVVDAAPLAACRPLPAVAPTKARPARSPVRSPKRTPLRPPRRRQAQNDAPSIADLHALLDAAEGGAAASREPSRDATPRGRRKKSELRSRLSDVAARGGDQTSRRLRDALCAAWSFARPRGWFPRRSPPSSRRSAKKTPSAT